MKPMKRLAIAITLFAAGSATALAEPVFSRMAGMVFLMEDAGMISPVQ